MRRKPHKNRKGDLGRNLTDSEQRAVSSIKKALLEHAKKNFVQADLPVFYKKEKLWFYIDHSYLGEFMIPKVHFSEKPPTEKILVDISKDNRVRPLLHRFGFLGAYAHKPLQLL